MEKKLKMFESQFEEKLKMVESPFEEEPRYRETRLHPSVSKSKVDEQLTYSGETNCLDSSKVAAPKPQHQNPSLNYGCKDDKFEDGKRPPNCVETSKPQLDDKKIDKGCL